MFLDEGNNDAEIGKLLADAMRKVSKDGVITIEESKSRDTNIGVVEGMQQAGELARTPSS